MNKWFLLTLLLNSIGLVPVALAQGQENELQPMAEVCEIAPAELRARYLVAKEQWPCQQGLPGDLAALPAVQETVPALVTLGVQLFHDPRLSSNGKVACSSCHQPQHQFNDTVRISAGVEGREGRRTTPSLMNVDLWPVLFWDARENNLTALAVQPLTNPVEMNSTPEHAAAAVANAREYAPLFENAFGDTEVSWERMAEALAAFQRTLRSQDYDYEKFIQAIEDKNFDEAGKHINDEQLLGLHLFRTRARCVQCHHGPLLSDFKTHNMGLHYFGRKYEDLGVYAQSGNAEDVGHFRTPTLRHVSKTGPWMHNGLFPTMLGIVRMYGHGGPRPKPRADQVNNPLFPETSDELIPFNLSYEEQQALVTFLNML